MDWVLAGRTDKWVIYSPEMETGGVSSFGLFQTRTGEHSGAAVWGDLGFYFSWARSGERRFSKVVVPVCTLLAP